MKLILIGVAAFLLGGCGASAKTSATVTDPSVAMASSEAAALAGTGGERLVKGCSVQILKVTDRALRVNALKCPESPAMMPLAKWQNGTEGWIAKSATDF